MTSENPIKAAIDELYARAAEATHLAARLTVFLAAGDGPAPNIGLDSKPPDAPARKVVRKAKSKATQEHAAAKDRARLHRAQVLSAVLEHKGMTSAQVADKFGVPQTNAAFHLRTLVDAGEPSRGGDGVYRRAVTTPAAN